MNKDICFGTCTDRSNATRETQRLWMLDDLAFLSESILTCKHPSTGSKIRSAAEKLGKGKW